MNFAGIRQARGVALVTALVVAALTTAAAVAMASRTQVEIGRVTNTIDAARRQALVARVEASVRNALSEDARGTGFDAGDEAWASSTFTVSDANGEASARVLDVQRLFNLNNLVSTPRNLGTDAGSARATSQRDAGTATGDSVPPPSVTTENVESGRAVNSLPRRRNTRGDRRSAPVDRAAPVAESAGDMAATPDPGSLSAPEQQFIERTRRVLAPSVGQLVSGRGRPADLAARVARSNIPRVSETYLEAVPGALTGDAIGVKNDTEAAPAAPAPSTPPSTSSARSSFVSAARNASRAGSPSPASSPFPPSPAVPAADGPALRTAAASGAGAAAPTSEAWQARFSLLLQRLGIDEPVLQPILDWLDADSDVRFPNGAEDAYYLKLDTPYRAANRPFADISELLLVRGVTPEIYARLAPYVTALKNHTDVNVNTAPAEVLMSLAPAIDRRVADMIIAARDVQPFQSVDAILALPVLTYAGVDGSGMAVGTEFFEVTTTVTSGAATHQSQIILGRTRNGHSQIVRRRNGYFDE